MFDIPDGIFRVGMCTAWCPSEKPTPPHGTGLIYMNGSDPETGKQWAGDREFWEGESLTYGCIDGTEGINAGDSTTVSFLCRRISINEYGTYGTPNVDQGDNWPACRKRTTTIKPPIKLALAQLLDANDKALTEHMMYEAYQKELHKGDTNYYLTVTIPSFIVLFTFMLIVCCCTRADNPLCKYMSAKYKKGHRLRDAIKN